MQATASLLRRRGRWCVRLSPCQCPPAPSATGPELVTAEGREKHKVTRQQQPSPSRAKQTCQWKALRAHRKGTNISGSSAGQVANRSVHQTLAPPAFMLQRMETKSEAGFVSIEQESIRGTPGSVLGGGGTRRRRRPRDQPGRRRIASPQLTLQEEQRAFCQLRFRAAHQEKASVPGTMRFCFKDPPYPTGAANVVSFWFLSVFLFFFSFQTTRSYIGSLAKTNSFVLAIFSVPPPNGKPVPQTVPIVARDSVAYSTDDVLCCRNACPAGFPLHVG